MKAKIIIPVLCLLTLTAVLSAVALNHHDEPLAARRFEVHGQIRAIDPANKTVRIAHDAIPNYMPAMIMPFSVKDGKILNGLSAGDDIQFELLVTTNDSWVSNIKKIDDDPPPVPAAEPVAPDSLRIGESVPDFHLTDQDGHPVQLSDFRGKIVLLTFIYTRCPLPNFCPLMSRNFEALQARLSRQCPGKFHLLTISMDPEFDHPDVLKNYAANYDANDKVWTFATGTSDEIRFVAGSMGLYYAKEGGLISHDFRTALIGPDGRLKRLWKSNLWTPDEAQDAVREQLNSQPLR